MLFQVLLTLGLFLTVTTIVYRLVGVRKIIECVKNSLDRVEVRNEKGGIIGRQKEHEVTRAGLRLKLSYVNQDQVALRVRL